MNLLFAKLVKIRCKMCSARKVSCPFFLIIFCLCPGCVVYGLFFLFCFCGAFFVFAVLVFVIVGFLVCKVGIDKSVSVAFTDGVCLWYGWCLCMDGSAIFFGLDCAFW